MKSNPEWDKYIEDNIDDPRYYVVTDKMDNAV
jgi:hypothetical protein